jgi:hypothetical protein
MPFVIVNSAGASQGTCTVTGSAPTVTVAAAAPTVTVTGTS